MDENLVKDVHNIEVNSFNKPWSYNSFINELNNPSTTYFVAYCNNTPAGYIGMWEIAGQCDITNVATLPQFRRQGVATGLISHLIEHCKNQNLSPLTLEVRETNTPAKNLYQSLGFKPIGFRKKYYSDTGEDAIIMSLEL